MSGVEEKVLYIFQTSKFIVNLFICLANLYLNTSVTLFFVNFFNHSLSPHVRNADLRLP